MIVPPATDAARDGPSSRIGEKVAPLLLPSDPMTRGLRTRK